SCCCGRHASPPPRARPPRGFVRRPSRPPGRRLPDDSDLGAALGRLQRPAPAAPRRRGRPATRRRPEAQPAPAEALTAPEFFHDSAPPAWYHLRLPFPCPARPQSHGTPT